MTTEAEIIAKGKSDYFSQKGVYSNPYPPASPEFNHYERGWMQSLKINNGLLVESSNKPAAIQPEKKATDNRYAELKGRSGPLPKGPPGN